MLRTGALTSGGLLIGGAVLSGSATAKHGGTGFLAQGSGLEEGKTFSIFDRESTLVDIGVACEANGRTRSIYTKYRIIGPDVFSLFLWVKGENPLEVDDEFTVERLRECGTVTVNGGSFEAEKITFSPVETTASPR